MQRTSTQKKSSKPIFYKRQEGTDHWGKISSVEGKNSSVGKKGKIYSVEGKNSPLFFPLRLSIDACRKRKSAPGSSSKRNHLKSLRFLLSSFSISAQCLPFSAASHSGKDNMAKNNQEPCLTCVQFCGAHRTVCPGPPVVTDKSTKHDKTDTARKRMPLNRPMPDPSDELKFSCRKMNFIV